MPFESASHASGDRPLRGIAVRCVMVAIFALMATLIKLTATRGVGVIEIVFYRNLFSLPVILLSLVAGRRPASVRTKRPGAHLIRAVIGLSSMLLTFQALTMLPLVEATTIGFTAPLFATILSAALLRESIGRRRWAAVAVGFIGVLVVAQPGDFELPLAGVVVALVGAITVSTVTITIRQIGATEAATTTVFWFAVAGVLAGGLAMPFVARLHDPATWLLLVLIGSTGAIAQLLQTYSLRIAPVSVLAPFDYSQLVWALALTWLVWGTLPSGSTIAGGGLIAASGLYTAWREHRRRITPPTTPLLTE